MTAATNRAPGQNSAAPLVDTHAHIFLQDLPLVEGATHLPARSFTAQDYLKTLDENGVLYGVIAAPSFLGSYNDYTIDAMRTTRRLRATAIVEPSIDRYALKAMDADGIVGIRFSLRRYSSPDLTSPEYRRLLRRVADLGWHVHLFAEGPRLAALLPLLVDSGVNLVVDHFGAPVQELGEESPGFQAILRALPSGRTWVKMSAPYRFQGVDCAALARKLLAEAGPDRLLWGSDWPWTGFDAQFGYHDTIAWFEDWVPDAATREKIGRTAAALYRFI